MKSPVLSILVVAALLAPASAAEPGRHRVVHHHTRHIVGTRAQHGQAGFPITAAQDSIRINAVGEVISQPTPVIRKERNFNERARKSLASPPPPQGAPIPDQR